MKKRALLWIGALAMATVLVGCGGKTARVLVEEEFAQTALFTQLCQAFEEETGYTVRADSKKEEQIEKALTDNQFDAALVVTDMAATPLQDGTWTGKALFYDTLLFVGPEKDLSCVSYLKQYSAADVLRHIMLTDATFVHAPEGSELQAREAALWAIAQTTPEAQQYIAAADDGQALLQTANEQQAYTLVTRQTWAQYGEQYEDLAVLNSTLPGITDQYYILGKPAEEGQEEPTPAQQFVQWMQGETARGILAAYQSEGHVIPDFELNE